jgi:hypothetical protein
MDSSTSGKGVVVGSCEHGSEPSGSVKDWRLLDQLSDNYMLKESAVCS